MIALSFDMEEFDLPLEHGIEEPFGRQVEVSRQGALNLLEVLRRENLKATMFFTVRFAQGAEDVLRQAIADGHEIASHGVMHTGFDESHPRKARIELEKFAGREILGYRQPRMMKLDEKQIAEAGYRYDASLNPTFIPGRYCNLATPRRPFMKDGVLQIPASVFPIIRFPIFWLSAHNFPGALYRLMARAAASYDGLFNTYFHPWEFTDLKALPYRLPGIITRNSGAGMLERLTELIRCFKKRNAEFVTYSDIYYRYQNGQLRR